MVKKLTQSKILAWLLCAAISVSFAACASRPRVAKTSDGEVEFRLGYAGTPNSLNPYAAANEEAASVLSLLYDTLFIVDIETGKYINYLCQEYSVSDSSDGAKLWSVTLRNDVFWHDGEPLTAKDVVFSLRSAKDLSTLYSYPELELLNTQGISTDDDYHFSFIVWEDYPYVEECLSHIPILPAHIWNTPEYMEYGYSGQPNDLGRALTELLAIEPTAETMVGSGLYKWGSYQGSVCRLNINESYWNGTASAKVVELVYGLIDPASELRSGRIDACYSMSGKAYRELTRENNSALTAGTTGEMYLLSYNLHEDALSNGNELLRDPAVRQAIDYCLDRGELLRSAFGGGIAQAGLLTPYSNWYYDASDFAAWRRYSPEKAKAMLESAGYRDSDGDGTAENSEGEKLSFSLLCGSSTPAWTKAANAIAASCAEAGIAVEVRVLESEKLSGFIDSRNFDILLTGWKTFNDPFFSFGLFYWDNGRNAWSIPMDDGSISYPGWNETGYHSEEYDALYRQMLFASDSNSRSTMVQRLGELLYRDVPASVLGFSIRYQCCGAAWAGARTFRNTGLYFMPEIMRQQLQGLNHGEKAA